MRSLLCTCLFVVAMAVAAPTSAVTFNLIYDVANSDEPASDPDGSKLMNIVTAAAARWSDLIEDNHAMTIYVRYDASLGSAASAPVLTQDISTNRTLSGDLNFITADTWYYDPTPYDDSEFDMGQMLFEDLSAIDQTNLYNVTSAEPLLENGFSGAAIAPAAQGKSDLLKTAMHELGHHLGVTNQLAGNYDPPPGISEYPLPPAMLGGSVMAARTTDISHLVGSFFSQSLMKAGTDFDIRRLPSATDVLAAAGASNWTQIDLQRQDFLASSGGTNFWSTASLWEGNSVPDADDTAFVRNGQNVVVFSIAHVENLVVARGSDLSVGGTGTMIVDGTTTIGPTNVGLPSQISISLSRSLVTGDLVIEDGSIRNLGGTLRANGDILNESLIDGHGLIQISGTLVNSGAIQANNNGTLTIANLTTGAVVDLDGANNDGVLNVNNGNADFLAPISSTFRGTINVGKGRYVSFNNAWTLGKGTLNLSGQPGLEAELRGSPVIIEGNLNVTGGAMISAELTVLDGGDLSIPNASDVLILDADVTFNDTNGGSHGGDGKIVVNENFLLQDGNLRIGEIEIGPSGSFDFDGGKLSVDTFTGDLANTGGILAPGSSAGETYISQRFVQDSSGTLEIEIGGYTPGTSHDFIEIEDSASVEGSIDVSLVPGFTPMTGDLFEVFTAGNLSVGSLSLTGSAANRFEIDVKNESIYLRAIDASLAGDYNDDGMVNAADYALWRNNLGDLTEGNINDNGNGTGGVDPLDYGVWRSNFGNLSSGAGNGDILTAIPEPASANYIVIAVVAALVRRISLARQASRVALLRRF